MNDSARRLKDFFETLSPATVPRLRELYAPGARFKDPFNEVEGVAAIESIFTHMYTQVDAPRFVVRDVLAQGDQVFMSWEFCFMSPRLGKGEQCIRGATHFRLDADGRVLVHRDYWDAAEELYAKLPVIGALMRFLRRRAAS